MGLLGRIIKALTGSETPATDEKSRVCRRQMAEASTSGTMEKLEEILASRNYNRAVRFMEKNRLRLTLEKDSLALQTPPGFNSGDILDLVRDHERGIRRALSILSLAQDVEGFSHLHRAARDNNPQETLRWLKNGSPIDVGDNHGRTPLHLTATFGSSNTARILLKAGADPQKRDSLKQTPLHKAAVGDHPEILKDLLQAGGDPEIPDSAGDRCLHLAVEYSSPQCTALLIEIGSHRNAPNNRGETPRDMAMRIKDPRILPFFS